MFIRAVIAITLFIVSVAVHSAGKHVHGEADLYFAVQSIDSQTAQVLIELESPADNFLGFEHAPKTQAQQQRVESVLQTLEDYRHLVTIENNHCQQLSHNTYSPFANIHSGNKQHDHHKGHEHDHHDHQHHAHEKHDQEKHDHDNHKASHSDFRVTYTLQCDGAADLINITAFEHFQGFKKVTVNWLNDKSQGVIKATKTKASNLTLK